MGTTLKKSTITANDPLVGDAHHAHHHAAGHARNERIVMRRKMREEEEVPAPNFIFCTGDANALRVHPSDRRFTVIRMGTKG